MGAERGDRGMSSSDVASAIPLVVVTAEIRRVFYPVALAVPLVGVAADPEYEVRHSGIAVRAAERWSATLSDLEQAGRSEQAGLSRTN